MTEQEQSDWVNNEYELWETALESCSVDNFKLHPMVRRMLSCDMGGYFEEVDKLDSELGGKLSILDAIGNPEREGYWITPCGARFARWALELMKFNPTSIVEIGGGVGQLYATLRLLGWDGEYYIHDRPIVQTFQNRYLNRVTNEFGVETWLNSRLPLHSAMCVSCYALGEFPEVLRQNYIDAVVSKCPKGLIVWNPGPKYSPEINLPFEYEIADEVPLTQPGNKVITWGR